MDPRDHTEVWIAAEEAAADPMAVDESFATGDDGAHKGAAEEEAVAASAE